jgi:transcriptional regulator with XRE-family HTH domain
MEDEKLKYQIGRNIASYRKRAGLTQAGLAERLNYSDKAISKWERGESAPDVLTLVQLSEQFGITVNDLLVDPDALPEETGAVQQAMEQVVEKALKRKADKGTILSLSSILVWFVALFAYVMLSCFELTEAWSWIFFIYAIPANAIVLLSLRSAWHDFRWNQILISIIMWGSILSVYVSLLVFLNWNIWRMFLLGIPGQAAVLLWFRLFRKPRKEETHG